jgi:AcrR family transcriptional regulator
MDISASPSLRERKKIATKERIFFEALDLFRQKGFDKATVEEIAEAAEVSKGTFFNYYPSKEALLHHLGERQARATAEAAQAALADPRLDTRQKLIAVLRDLAGNVEADRELSRAAVFEYLKLPAVIMADPNRSLFRQTVGALLAEGQRRGEVAPSLDPDLLSSAVTGIYFQQVFEWCAAETPFALSDQLERLIAVLWDGMK